MNQRLMIYGATGYTGKLLTSEAVAQKLNPIIAGRDPAKIAALAAQFGLSETRCFGLADPAEIQRHLADIICVIHAAGPFSETAAPMIDACIASKTHYVDITGEFTVYALAESLTAAAEKAGVMLMPGVGWDVIPSDGIALHASRRVAQPQSLSLGLRSGGGVSRGSIKSIGHIIAVGPKARRDGIVVAPEDLAPRHFDFGDGPQLCLPMPMGDIITSWKSTGIANIDVFFATSEDSGFVVGADVETLPEGPSPEMRAAARSQVIAEVTGANGVTVRSMIDTISGYAYTGISGVAVAKRVLAGDAPTGFQSPASAYGASLSADIGGTIITDLTV